MSVEVAVEGCPSEGLAGCQLARVNKARIPVRDIAVGGDVSPLPPSPSEKLEADRLPTDGIEAAVPRPTGIGGEHLGEVI